MLSLGKAKKKRGKQRKILTPEVYNPKSQNRDPTFMTSRAVSTRLAIARASSLVASP